MVTGNFWNTEFPDGEYSKSAGNVQHINQVLSTITAQEVPTGKREKVTDYIHFALLHETIEPAIKGNMKHLLNELQKFQNIR